MPEAAIGLATGCIRNAISQVALGVANSSYIAT